MDRIFPFIAVEKQNTNFNCIFSTIVGMELSIFCTGISLTCKAYIYLKAGKPVKKKYLSSKNDTWPYRSTAFFHEIKTKDYKIIDVNVILCNLMRFLRKKG